MDADLKRCPQCDQLIPQARFSEHISTHKRYGTGKRYQQSHILSTKPPSELRADSSKSELVSIQSKSNERLEEDGIFLDLLLQLVDSALSERNADILCRRFGLLGTDGQTLSEIGQEFKLTRERIRQLVNKSLRKINTKAKRQFKNGQIDEPGARLVKLINEAIRPGEEGEDTRMLTMCAEQLPNLHPVKYAAPLIGYFLGGTNASQSYQGVVGQLYRARFRKEHQEAYLLQLVEKQGQRFKDTLQDVVWPKHTSILTVDKAASFSGQRSISKDGFGETGEFFSAKLQREVEFESNLERYFLELLESIDDVVFYQEQPLKIAYNQQGRRTYYFPDILFLLRDGRVVVVEIKPRNEMALFHNWTKWTALQRYCHRHGYGFLVTDGRYSMQNVAQRQVRESVRLALLSALDNSALDWQKYKAIRKEFDIKTYELYALIIQERLIWELRPFLLKREVDELPL